MLDIDTIRYCIIAARWHMYIPYLTYIGYVHSPEKDYDLQVWFATSAVSLTPFQGSLVFR